MEKQSLTMNSSAQPLKKREKKKKKNKGVQKRVILAAANLPIPQSEKALFLGELSKVHLKQAADYLMCLFNPAECHTRYPDSTPRETFVIPSELTFTIPINIDTTSDSGRFAMAVQPTLGNLSDPTFYKISLVKPTSGPGGTWPTNLTIADSFQSIVGLRDVRLDPFYSTLTQQSLAVVSLAGGPGASVHIPFGTAVTEISGYGLSVGYTVAAGYGIFRLPVGTYAVTIQIVVGSGDDPRIILDPGPNTVWIPQFYNNSTGSVTTDEVGTLTGYLTIGDVDSSFTVSYASGTLVSANMMLATTFDDNASLATSDDFGILQGYRPVGMACLVKYVGTSLNDGGSIAAAYVPADTLRSQYFTQNLVSPQGNLSSWENLSLIGGQSGYVGAIRTGAYVWWSPQSEKDWQINKPSEWSRYIPPSLVISGVFSPGSGATGPQAPLQATVWTVYEGVTTSQLFDKQTVGAMTSVNDAAKLVLAHLNHAMENPGHSRLTEFLKKGVNFIAKNKSWLGPMASALAGLL